MNKKTFSCSLRTRHFKTDIHKNAKYMLYCDHKTINGNRKKEDEDDESSEELSR